jgi:hypothetical protein
MLLRIQYPSFNHDYVDSAALDRLIASKSIIKFLRPSETFWVNIEQEPIRGRIAITMDTAYTGPERRQSPATT